MIDRKFAANLLSSASLIAFAAVLSTSTAANPEGGKVVAGDAAIKNTAPNEVTVNQTTDKAIIDWESFNIDRNERTRFQQPSSTSVTLNRDVSGNPSAILGQLQANGQIFLINRSGILFGENARIDVAGLVASTADITNENFLSGNYDFDIPGTPDAAVINLGKLSIADHGLAALVAPHVRNDGVIVARLGKVALASGDGFALDMHGDDMISLFVEDADEQQFFDLDGKPIDSLVDNNGRVVADGGLVVLTAAGARQAVNNVVTHDGVIEAKTIERKNGQIILGGDVEGDVVVTGDILATGDDVGETGGHITVTGEGLALLDGASIDASGAAGGGTVLLGGDYMGGDGDPAIIETHDMVLERNPVPTADHTLLAPNVTVAADALHGGDGGKVIVWGNEATVSAAQISARGGSLFGDGGFVETSGKYLDVGLPANVSAPNGASGTWLLDPVDIVVENRPDRNNSFFDGFLFTLLRSGIDIFGRGFFPTREPSFIDTDTIEASLDQGTNVLVTTRFSTGSDDGNIEIKDSITKRGGGYTRLSFHAAGDIDVDRNVDFRSFGGQFDIELASFGGRLNAEGLGDLDLRGGNFIVSGRDGIDIDSHDEMPNMFVGVNIRPAIRSNVGVDIEFGDDRVKLSYNDELLTVPTGGIELVDLRANSFVEIETFHGTSLELEDRAILFDRATRGWRISGLADAGAAQSDALNDVPEVIGSAEFFVRSTEPTSGVFPVIEVSNDEGLTVDELIPTSPKGVELVEARAELKRRRRELEELQRRQKVAREEVERVEHVEAENIGQNTVNANFNPAHLSLDYVKSALDREYPGFRNDLYEHFQPEVVDVFLEKLSKNWIKRESFVQGSKLLIRGMFDPRMQKLLGSIGVNYTNFMSDFFLGSFSDVVQNVPADIGKDIVEDMVVDATRKWLVYDLMREKTEISENWLPVFDTAIEETLFLFKASAYVKQGNVQEASFEILDALIRRYEQFNEIVKVTNNITDIQERTFARTVAEVDALVQLQSDETYSRRAQYLENSYNQAREEIVGRLYGEDDAYAVSKVLEYTKAALEAEYAGNSAMAKNITHEMIKYARGSSNIHPFTLFHKPEDWFSAVSSLGKDAPERAAIIVLQVTPLSKYVA